MLNLTIPNSDPELQLVPPGKFLYQYVIKREGSENSYRNSHLQREYVLIYYQILYNEVYGILWSGSQNLFIDIVRLKE